MGFNIEEKLKLDGYEPVNVTDAKGLIKEVQNANFHMAERDYFAYSIIPLSLILSQRELKPLDDQELFVSYAKINTKYFNNFDSHQIFCKNKKGKMQPFYLLDK